jgi:hypothetical protein
MESFLSWGNVSASKSYASYEDITAHSDLRIECRLRLYITRNKGTMCVEYIVIPFTRRLICLIILWNLLESFVSSTVICLILFAHLNKVFKRS